MKAKSLVFIVILSNWIGIFSMLQQEYTKADEVEEPVINEDDSPYVYVSEADCSLSISSGTAIVKSSIEGNYLATSISITAYLERYNNGSWDYSMSWSHSGVNQSNTDSTNVISGIYRVRMSVTATSGGNTETFDVYGNIAVY